MILLVFNLLCTVVHIFLRGQPRLALLFVDTTYQILLYFMVSICKYLNMNLVVFAFSGIDLNRSVTYHLSLQPGQVKSQEVTAADVVFQA